MGEVGVTLKKFWNFLKEDSWSSLIVVLILSFIFIKFIFFPGLSFVTGTQLPLVIVESCSMYHHEQGFEEIFKSEVYEQKGLTLNDSEKWNFQRGLNKGDIIFVIGTKNVEVGEVIIFNGNYRHPLIHRVVSTGETYSTKGDNYITNPRQLEVEKSINPNQVVGKALFRVPLLGWVKLIFFEFTKNPEERGLCS